MPGVAGVIYPQQHHFNKKMETLERISFWILVNIYFRVLSEKTKKDPESRIFKYFQTGYAFENYKIFLKNVDKSTYVTFVYLPNIQVLLIILLILSFMFK
jgi:hypothetical protein